MRIKRFLTAILLVVFCFSFVSCGELGIIPQIEGSRKMTDEEVMEIYEQIMGDVAAMEFKSIKGHVSEKDEEYYYAYVEKCKESGFVHEGERVYNNLKISVFSTKLRPDYACLVAYRDNEFYVIELTYEIIASSKREFIWFTDEELALFHVKLTKPTGEVEGFTDVANSKKDVRYFFDILHLRITNKDKTVYNTFRQDLIASGYTLGAYLHEPDNYNAHLVRNNVEFSCHLAYEDGTIFLDIMNESQKTKSEQNGSIYNVYPTGTIGIKSVSYEYYQDDKNGEKYGQVTRYTYLSYDNRYLVEFYADELISDAVFGAFK
jgi:hypothetical protein